MTRLRPSETWGPHEVPTNPLKSCTHTYFDKYQTCDIWNNCTASIWCFNKVLWRDFSHVLQFLRGKTWNSSIVHVIKGLNLLQQLLGHREGHALQSLCPISPLTATLERLQGLRDTSDEHHCSFSRGPPLSPWRPHREEKSHSLTHVKVLMSGGDYY